MKNKSVPGLVIHYSDSLWPAIQESKRGGGEILSTNPDRPWGPPNLLYSEYRAFHGCKSAEAKHWPMYPTI